MFHAPDCKHETRSRRVDFRLRSYFLFLCAFSVNNALICLYLNNILLAYTTCEKIDYYISGDLDFK